VSAVVMWDAPYGVVGLEVFYSYHDTEI